MSLKCTDLDAILKTSVAQVAREKQHSNKGVISLKPL